MDFELVINKRKSIWAFKEKPVEEEKIKKILKLVNLAPSAGNLQSYKIFNKIKEILKTDLLPVAILPIGYPDEDLSRRLRKSPEKISQKIT